MVDIKVPIITLLIYVTSVICIYSMYEIKGILVYWGVITGVAIISVIIKKIFGIVTKKKN